MFTDFVNFTNIVATIPAKKLVEELNELFGKFDFFVHEHGLDKVKTIGDSYMAVAGLNESGHEHAERCILAAKDMLGYLAKRNARSDLKWEMRVGIHSGPVIGGVIGRDKLVFDLWGDTVNLASKMESSGAANQINISGHTRALASEKFPCSCRGKVETKGSGRIEMYFVD